MLSLCRLCANSLDKIEISSKISELEPKLKLCCGWTQSEHEWRMPQRACQMCVDELQRSWSFAERIQAAEQQLNKLMSETILDEPGFTAQFEEVAMTIVKEELYVDSIGPEQYKHDFDSGVVGDTIKTSDFESPHSNERQNSIQNTQLEDSQLDCDSTDVNSGSECTRKISQTINSNSDPFLAVLAPEDRLPDGQISANGVAKLEQLFPDMKTMTWADCKYKCRECNQIFQSPQKFFAHNRSFHYEQAKSIGFFCIYCDSKHRIEFELNQHIAKVHFPHLEFRCYFCEDYYWDVSKLKKHRNMHKDVEYECEQCGKIVWNRNTMFAHVTQKHLNRKYYNPEAKFICDICNKAFTTKLNIQYHMLLHTKQFDLVCDQCGRKFRTNSSLKLHLQTMHDTKRPFSCKKCDKKFKIKNQLYQHSIIHEEQKMFECSKCKKRFKRHSSLKIHTRIHTTEKPYSCNHCEYKSTNWPNLSKHSLRIHCVDLRIKKNS